MEEMNDLVKLLQRVELLNLQEFTRIEPIIRNAMASGIQDLDYLERIIEPLEDKFIKR